MSNPETEETQATPANDEFFGTPSEGGSEDSMVIDMSEVDENASSYDPVPQGTYPAFLSEAEFGHSQRSNNPMITWVFEVPEGHEFAGRKFWHHTTITDKGLPRLKKLLSRIAPDVDVSKFDVKNDPPKLVGREARLQITVRMYQGERTNNVKDVLPPVTQADDFFGEDDAAKAG